MQPSEACIEDPTKLRGEEWLCDDGCSTCTCGPDGMVPAFGCEAQAGDVGPPASSNHVEQITVAIAASAVIACLVCFVVLCCVMCRRSDSNQSTLVKASELEGADEDDD